MFNYTCSRFKTWFCGGLLTMAYILPLKKTLKTLEAYVFILRRTRCFFQFIPLKARKIKSNASFLFRTLKEVLKQIKTILNEKGT